MILSAYLRFTATPSCSFLLGLGLQDALHRDRSRHDHVAITSEPSPTGERGEAGASKATSKQETDRARGCLTGNSLIGMSQRRIHLSVCRRVIIPNVSWPKAIRESVVRLDNILQRLTLGFNHRAMRIASGRDDIEEHVTPRRSLAIDWKRGEGRNAGSGGCAPKVLHRCEKSNSRWKFVRFSRPRKEKEKEEGISRECDCE